MLEAALAPPNDTVSAAFPPAATLIAGTIFVYGQTGAGKTHTHTAVCRMALEQLYDAVQAGVASGRRFSLRLCCLEIYNETCR